MKSMFMKQTVKSALSFALLGLLSLSASAAPDLVVQSITHLPAVPTPGENVNFTVTLLNQGADPVVDIFSTGFWSDLDTVPAIDTTPEQFWDHLFGLAVSSTVDLTFNVVAPAAGTYTAWAYVDRFGGMGEIVEDDESNNVLRYSWLVEDNYEDNNALLDAHDLTTIEASWLSDFEGFGVQADDDWYEIVVTPGFERVLVDCQFTHADGDINIDLWNSAGNLIAFSAGTDDDESIDYQVPISGTYYIRVWGDNAGNTYDLWWDAAVLPTGSLDGDGHADISIFDPLGGNWYTQFSTTTNLPQAVQFGWWAVEPVPADYDGDGIADLAVYYPGGGLWYILESTTDTMRTVQWGWGDVAPVPGDYDGDDRADIAVFHQATGNWYIQYSTLNNDPQAEQFGWWDVVPVPADYDGDGRTDIAVYYPNGGTWYIRNSSTSLTRTVQWGWSQAVPVAGDYDGDGQTDIAVFHRATANWYIQYSTLDNAPQAEQFGWWQVVPVPEDYDGDGMTDIAVYYPDAGMWYIRDSSTGLMRSVAWGWSDAVPTLLTPTLHAWYGLP